MLKISLKDLQSDYDNENKIILDKPELQYATNERGHIIVDIITQKGDKIHARFVQLIVKLIVSYGLNYGLM